MRYEHAQQLRSREIAGSVLLPVDMQSALHVRVRFLLDAIQVSTSSQAYCQPGATCRHSLITELLRSLLQLISLSVCKQIVLGGDGIKRVGL